MTSSFNDGEWLVREQGLIALAARGDREAFAELYRAFARPLYAQVLFPRLGSAPAAEEVLADTFRVALEKLPSFRAEKVSLWFWLVSIATHRIADAHRAKVRSVRALGSFEQLLGSQPPPPDPASAFDRVREHEQLRTRIQHVLGQINPRYRQAIELRILEEHPRPVCAEAMGITLGNFDVLALRALRAFQRAWLAEGGEEVA